MSSYVGVSRNGTVTEQIQTSPDAVVWTARSSPIDTYGGTCVQYGAGLFVALGLDSGDGTTWIAVVSDDDGETWAAADLPVPSDSYTAITYSHDLDLWVGIGLFGEIITASDPLGTWTLVDTLVSDGAWYDITWSQGQFVALGDGDDIDVSISTNGSDWSLVNSGLVQPWRAVVYGERWLTVSTVILEADNYSGFSSDASAWTLGGIQGAGSSGVDWDGITYIATTGGSDLLKSTNHGVSWSLVDSSAWVNGAQRIIYDSPNGLWLVALDGDSPDDSTVATSDDGGATWTLQSTPITNNLREIACFIPAPAVTAGNFWRVGPGWVQGGQAF